MKRFGIGLMAWTLLAGTFVHAQQVVVPYTEAPPLLEGPSGGVEIPPSGIFSPGATVVGENCPVPVQYQPVPVQYQYAPVWSQPVQSVRTEIYAPAPVRRVAPPAPRYNYNVQPSAGYFVIPAPVMFGSVDRWGGRGVQDLGYDGMVEPRMRSSMYPAIPYRATPIDEIRTRFHVIVPAGNAVVLLDGKVTGQTGLSRYYYTPRLNVGQEYSMRVRAEWTENGTPRLSEQMVDFIAGEEVRVDFTRPANQK